MQSTDHDDDDDDEEEDEEDDDEGESFDLVPPRTLVPCV